jgi:thioredoxin reductase (NADPH)
VVKPVLLAVDDEPPVLAAVARDLRSRYGADYRILRAASGEEALDVLRQLRLREDPVALLLVDQRMPGMSGVELLAEAVELYPDARRVLLTAYADTEAAIRAINEVRLDHYLLKPWDPPEERLYPVLDDLLDDWQAAHPPPFQGPTVVGSRWSAEAHATRDFLTRNLVPFRWLDAETEEAHQLLYLAGTDASRLPLVLFPDADPLVQPSPADLADRLGLKRQPTQEVYDLVIVGGGPAGLAAAVYGASEGLRTVLIECRAPGGQAGQSARIENYLGFPVGLSGRDLTRRAVAQAARFGAEILTPLEATGIRLQSPYALVSLDDGQEVGARALLVSTGVAYRLLEVPGAVRLAGRGLYYGAAMAEALEAEGQDVFVIGGGNSAGQAAMYLARFARQVTILVRGPSLAATMSRYLVDQIEAAPSVEVWPEASVREVLGEDHLEALIVEDGRGGEAREVPAAAAFVFIGATPHTDWLDGSIERDPQGFILTGRDLESGPEGRPRGWSLRREPFWLEASVPGIFVAGDVRHRSVKRVASAVGEGAMAVQFVHQHLGSL